jgi:alpha-1,6-mannosyltransferase
MVPWLLLAAGEAIAVALLRLPDARLHLSAYLALMAAGLLVAFVAARSLSGSKPKTRFLVLCAAAFRITLLLRPADLSEDIWRYLWDGRVGRAGISPWALPPDDPSLASLSPALKARVTHREVRSVYPPAAQAVFRTAGFEERPWVLKAVFAAADVAIVALVARAPLPGASFAAALYAFHPLPVTETAGQGHVDSLGVALLVAAVVNAGSRRRIAAGIALALSVMTKYVSAAAALPLFRRGGWRTVLAAATVAAASWVAATRGGVSPAGGMDQYATRWEFNSVLYPAVYRGVEAARLPERAKADFLRWKARHGDPPWTAKVFPFFYSAFFARAILGIALAILLAFVALRVGELWAAVLASVGALLLFAPTLHPWYALWVLPFAAVRRNPAFLWLASVVPLAYGLLYTTGGLTPAAILAIEYVPFAILLVAVPIFRRRAAA